MEEPLVSVVIVTWNRKDDLLETVKSVHSQAYQNYEIIVVDNASADGTVAAIQETYPEVKVIALDQNMGASAGRNPGIIAAQGEIVFLLDSDASLGHDALSNVVSRFQASPEVGVVYCKIVNATTRELDISGSGWSFTEKVKARQESEFPSYSFSEGGSAIRKKVFNEVGLFWELLYFGAEGEELALRIWNAGYKVLYFPGSVVFHRVSPHHRTARKRWLYFNLRNMLYIFVVRYPWWMLAIFVPLKITASFVQATRRQDWQQVLGALRDVIRQMPVLLQQRQPISNETARIYLKLLRDHGRLSWDLATWLKHKT